jgi:hypothetical protein
MRLNQSLPQLAPKLPCHAHMAFGIGGALTDTGLWSLALLP